MELLGVIFQFCGATCRSVNCNAFSFDCPNRVDIVLFEFIVLLI